MFNIKNLAVIVLFSAVMMPACAQNAVKAPAKAPVNVPAAVQPVEKAAQTSPLELVANPNKFLNKKIIMDGKFDKFTTLGLDYKKAFKDSTQYIGFLVQRDDVKDHNVPLSELKLFMKRDYAEKFIDLNTGDKISMTGKVFSNALGDAWVEIETVEVLEKAPGVKEESK